MEMQEITTETEEQGKDEGASEPLPEAKSEALAEDESNPYSKLRNPSEDLYAEAFYSSAPGKIKTGNQTEGNTRLYRAVCFFLTIMCLLLLVVVIVLSLKLQEGSTACMGREGTPGQARQTPLDPACSFEQCQALLPRTNQSQQRHCMQCADGWLTLGQSCFYLSTARLSWEESQKNCTASGGSLAIISNAMVQQFLTVKGKFQYWIGLKKNGQAWTWVNNTVLTESYWADNPSNGDCGLLASRDNSEKNWKKASCQATTYFICQLHM